MSALRRSSFTLWRWVCPVLVLVLPCLGRVPAWAQGDATPKPRVGRATLSAVTPPLRLMQAPPPQEPSGPPREINPPGIPQDFLRGRAPVAPEADPLRQGFPTFRQAPSVDLSFNGIDGTANIPILGGQVAPPDANGDIGPDHYVQWVNSAFQVWAVTRNSAGHPTGFSVAQAPMPGNIFWQTLPAGSPCRLDNAGDPIVLYDHLAGRWLFSHFTSPNRPDGFQCVAVSQTSDPLGPYNAYQFPVSPGQFNDYPKLGVWQDGYYLTTNEFTGSFVGVNVTVFERNVILAGGASPRFIQFTLPFTGAAPVAFGLLPGHFTGVHPVPAGTCNFLVQAFDEEVWGDATAAPDGYRTWRACVNWTNPLASSLTELPFVTTSSFDSELCGFSGNCIPQPGTANGLDVLGQFTKYRATVKHFPASNQTRMVFTHDVDVTGTSRAGVRWVDLELDATPALLDTGTFAPNDGQNRWMSSAAFDSVGNIGITFTRSGGGAGQFPSVLFTGREAGDPPGQLQSEGVCVLGGGAQTGTNRWGDYASISIDPVDQCTFWMTNEYTPANTPFTWFTRICTFRFPSCSGFPSAGIDQVDHEIKIDLFQRAASGTDTLLETLTFSGRMLLERGDPYTNANGRREIAFLVTNWEATAWSSALSSMVVYRLSSPPQPMSFITAQTVGSDFPATFDFNLHFDATAYGQILILRHHGRPKGHGFWTVPPTGDRSTSPTITLFEPTVIEASHPQYGVIYFKPRNCNDQRSQTVHTFTTKEKENRRLPPLR